MTRRDLARSLLAIQASDWRVWCCAAAERTVQFLNITEFRLAPAPQRTDVPDLYGSQPVKRVAQLGDRSPFFVRLEAVQKGSPPDWIEMVERANDWTGSGHWIGPEDLYGTLGVYDVLRWAYLQRSMGKG